VLDSGFLAWNGVGIVESVGHAADGAVGAVESGDFNEGTLVFSGHGDKSITKTDGAGLVLVEDGDSALCVVSLYSLLGDFVDELHFEILIRLPVRVVHNANLELALLFVGFHGEALVLLVVVLAGLGGVINGTHPEGEVLEHLLFNGDDNMAVRFSYLVLEMLKANRLGVILS